MSVDFTTRLCDPAVDVPTLARIRYDAFANNPHNTTPDELTQLFESEPDPDSGRPPTRDEAIAAAHSKMAALFEGDKYRVVGVYSAAGVLAGAAVWQYITPDTPSSVPETDAKEREHPSLVNRFFAQMNRTREHHMAGKTYSFLKLLIIDPDYQRKGLGGKLLKWGIDQAAQQGVPAWLESSPMGKALYEKNGFRVVLWDRVDEKRAQRGFVDWPVMLWDGKQA